MAVYVYRPDHPMANENGHVEKSLALEWDAINSPDNRAIIGNQVVTLNFISDMMEPTRHMADGKYYSSKAKFREVTKAHGCIEVGNDSSVMNPKPRKISKPSTKQRREDIKKAIYQVKNGIKSI